jgi:hypothetical protein
MPGVVIHHVEVHLEVEGNDEASVFTRMFNQHITRWQRDMRERDDRSRQADCERRLNGPSEGEEGEQ